MSGVIEAKQAEYRAMILRGEPAVNDNRREPSMPPPTNRVVMLGRLCGDPIATVTDDGRRIVRFSLMSAAPNVERSACDLETGGPMAGMTCHQIVVADRRLSTFAATKLTGGSEVRLEGQLQTRRASDPNSGPKIVTEVVLFGEHARLCRLQSAAGKAVMPPSAPRPWLTP